jgi:hypothetical protein
MASIRKRNWKTRNKDGEIIEHSAWVVDYADQQVGICGLSNARPKSWNSAPSGGAGSTLKFMLNLALVTFGCPI